MQSSLFPNIVFLQNDNLAFLGTAISEREKLHLLHPKNPLNNHYADLVCKLFSEVKIIKEMLWIGRIPSTQIIRIYFSEPYQYPAASCCRNPVFIEVDNDRSGRVVCTKCSKEMMKFVKAGKGPDEEMFRITQKQVKTRKDELKSLLTSLKFRGSKLRNNFLNSSKVNQNDLIVEICEVPTPSHTETCVKTTLSPSCLELKCIINDIFT